MELSKKQISAMGMVGKLGDKFGIDRWFTQAELPGITRHTTDALVSKGYLSWKEYNGVVYYRRLKEIGDES